MREVKFKNKEAKHSLNVQGKMITFENGIAKVNDKEAEAISELNNPEYEVVPVAEEPKEEPKEPAKKSRRAKRK